jgi:D-alanyl-D-alanine carboxypeptidase/D-alanyl-D-alanine-endopeptidase (penicillin-binding protein 4)
MLIFRILGFLCLLGLLSCSSSRFINSSAKKNILQQELFDNAHTGIAIFDPSTDSYLYSHQANKYFVPASNTKIISCYAGMKYLGNQLLGLQYIKTDTAIFLIPTGDPSFLHKDFPVQPVADFIKQADKPLYMVDTWNDNPLGMGWSWDDYSEDYMVERSPFPIYGNFIRWFQVKGKKEMPTSPSDTIDTFIYSDPEATGEVRFGKPSANGVFQVQRDREANNFTIFEGREKNAETEIPFVTHGITTALQMIEDSLHVVIHPYSGKLPKGSIQNVYSQPTDSMFTPMMHRSDNFFAEQTLLMAGNALGTGLQTNAAVQQLLKNELSGFPDLPRWVDGSGLSRYNLFSPRDFVWILNKMRNEFGWDRLTNIMATGGNGTLGALYKADSTRIYAKTGSLTGVNALSGFLVTKKNKILIFSVLINNHRQPAAAIRKQVAQFIHEIIDHY